MSKGKDLQTFVGLTEALQAIKDEQDTATAAWDNLRSLVLDAVSLYEAGDIVTSHERMRVALDIANLVLGSTDGLLLLAATLGYEGPDPEDEPLR